MATQEDRSLSSGGVPIPKWMKGRITDKFDFDQTAFSPTELDDSFMYHYRNPFTNSSLMGHQKETEAEKSIKPDFSKHTPPCQRFLNNNDISYTQQMKTPPPLVKVKSSGTDDGFKGEAAKCGSSIIKVAHQMVAGKMVHDFSLKSSTDCDSDVMDEPVIYNRHRRGSRSLPASPSGSPKERRRANKYFTSPFIENGEKSIAGSWILSNLLARREMSQSVGFINEETKEELDLGTLTRSIDDLDTKLGSKNQTFTAKPSELREMNFWSPTSM